MESYLHVLQLHYCLSLHDTVYFSVVYPCNLQHGLINYGRIFLQTTEAALQFKQPCRQGNRKGENSLLFTQWTEEMTL